MCVPLCQAKIVQSLSRRNFVKLGGIGAATLAVSSCVPPTASSAVERPQYSFSHIVDLTHTLTPDFPTYFGPKQLAFETVAKRPVDASNIYKWLVVEHTGTHLDAPFHFSDKDTADQIPVEDLFGPLAIVDIRAKAARNADAQLTPDDLKAWESQHGQLPDGSIVAMYSGWDAYVKTNKFRNLGLDDALHFPGFHVEAVAFLLEERKVKGIMVDSLGLDHGVSTDFAVHNLWLPANHWGMECVANLGQLPVKGAHVIIGGPKIAGASGGPSRVLALV